MRRLPLLCAFLLLTGCYDSRFGERSGGEEPEPATATIAQLRQLYAGTTFVIATDVVVSGRVNTSDAEENFYRTFCVEEDGAGLEVMAGIDHLHNDFPPGSRVTLRLKGLALGDYGGKIQLGTAPDGDYGVGRIPREELGRYLRRNPDKDRRPQPAVCTFDAIGPRQTDTYVCFEGVRFTEAGPWCDTDPETSEPQTSERTLTDAQGRTFRVRTLGTCAYATEPVPQGTGSVYGIIDYFNGKYTLRVSERRVEFANAAGLPRAYPSTGRYSAPKPTK